MVVTSVAMLAGCKQKASTTSVKTLDNFAAGTTLTNNVCTGDPTLTTMPGYKVLMNGLQAAWKFDVAPANASQLPQMQTAVKNAFAALPSDLQNVFLALKGRVVVTQYVNQLCTVVERADLANASNTYTAAEKKLLQQGLDASVGCFRFLQPADRISLLGPAAGGGPNQMLFVFIKDDVSTIQSNLVRTFGYLASTFLSHLTVTDMSATGTISWSPTEKAAFRAKKSALADAFLADVKGRPSSAWMSYYVSRGGQSAQGRKEFEDFVYAEAFDSFYCNTFATDSKNTLKAMKSGFPRTFQAFVTTASTTKSASLSLTAGSAIKSAALGAWNWASYAGSTVVNAGSTVATNVSQTVTGIPIAYNDYSQAVGQRVQNIYSQVQNGNGGDVPGPVQTASTVLNATVNNMSENYVPFAGAAGNLQKAITGDGFNTESGNYASYSADQRTSYAKSGTVNAALDALFVHGLDIGGAEAKGAQVVSDSVNGVTRTSADELGSGVVNASAQGGGDLSSVVQTTAIGGDGAAEVGANAIQPTVDAATKTASSNPFSPLKVVLPYLDDAAMPVIKPLINGVSDPSDEGSDSTPTSGVTAGAQGTPTTSGVTGSGGNSDESQAATPPTSDDSDSAGDDDSGT